LRFRAKIGERDFNVAKKKQTDVELCFEDALKELEAIVGKLEGGKLGLEDSLEQYEHGVQHLKQCYQLLRHAERRIELVSGLDGAGKAQTVSFDEDEAETLSAKGEARGRRRSVSSERASTKRPASDEVDDESSLF
jgi:exodeoxyribonuclease VII small subunit